MEISKLELHDANLLGVALDPVSRTAEIRLAYYEDSKSSTRVQGALLFRGVRRFNQIVDLELLGNHAVFGNVTQWIWGEREGTGYMLLARGLIEIASDSVELVSEA